MHDFMWETLLAEILSESRVLIARTRRSVNIGFALRLGLYTLDHGVAHLVFLQYLPNQLCG